MDIQTALAYGRYRLYHASSTPDVDARLLLQYTLQAPHSFLVAHGEEALTAVQAQTYHSLIQQAVLSAPVPYLTGTAPFFHFDVAVTPAVLIPRPETEQLVETAVTWAKSHTCQQVVDVGTGSGCIALACAHFLPHAAITAVDISADALAVARDNWERHLPGRIMGIESDLLTELPAGMELIIANLPYVTLAEWETLEPNVKQYEPRLALVGGEDGLDLIRRLLAQAQEKIRPGGALFLEIGWRQGTAVTELAQAVFPTATIQLHPDYAGLDRIVSIQTTEATP